MAIPDEFEDLPSDELFPDEHELKKDIKRLERQMKRLIIDHEKALDVYRQQIEELLAKNMSLTEANNIFAKGLEQLKKDGKIVTETHHWDRHGKQTLKVRVEQLAQPPAFGADVKRRIVSVFPLRMSSHGDVIEAVIVTEHIEKKKNV